MSAAFPVEPWSDIRFQDCKGRTFSRADLLSYRKLFFVFAAGWSAACRHFVKHLRIHYETITRCRGEGALQVVFVSFDETAEKMQQFFQTMPWVTVPYRNVECSGRLKLLFRVTEVPKLVCVNCQTLEMITVAGSRGASCGGGPRQFLHPGGQHASYPEAVPSTSRAAGPNRIAECTDRLQCMDLRKRFGPGADALEAYDDLDYTDASHAQSATES